MCDTRVHLLLLLQKEVNVALLENERQREALNRKRHLFRIVVEAEQIEFARNRLDTTLHFTDTRLATRKVLHDVLENILANIDLLKETRLTECFR